MMKVNTKDTDSLFESFAKYTYNFGEKMISDSFNKRFSFSMYPALF